MLFDRYFLHILQYHILILNIDITSHRNRGGIYFSLPLQTNQLYTCLFQAYIYTNWTTLALWQTFCLPYVTNILANAGILHGQAGLLECFEAFHKYYSNITAYESAVSTDTIPLKTSIFLSNYGQFIHLLLYTNLTSRKVYTNDISFV